MEMTDDKLIEWMEATDEQIRLLRNLCNILNAKVELLIATIEVMKNDSTTK